MPKFEVPSQVRAVAEQSFEQARKAFDSLFAATQRAVATFEGQAAAAQAAAQDVQHKAVGYTERNIAASFGLAQKLLRAKDPEEAMRLHADHLKAKIETLTEQARELGRTATVAMNPAKPQN
jgi:phasin